MTKSNKTQAEVQLESQTVWSDALGGRAIRLYPDKSPCSDGGGWMFAGTAFADAPWGAVIPDGVVVIDVDVRDDTPGLMSMKRLFRAAGIEFNNQYAVRTPSGGYHIYMQCDRGVKLRGKLTDYPGIDIKSKGGYVVGVGSNAEYTTKAGTHIVGSYSQHSTVGMDYMQHAPEALMELLIKPDIALTETALTDFDESMRDTFETRCEAWMQMHGAENRYSLACTAVELGLPPSLACAIMEEAGFDDDGRLESKVEHAYDYAQNAVGAKNPKSVFDVLPVEDSAIPKPADKDFFVDLGVGGLPHPKWLIRNYMERGTIGLVIGHSQTFKSFLMLDMAFSIALDRPWQKHEVVHSGPVIYVAGEGQGGLRRRVIALEKHHGVTVPPGKLLMPRRSMLIGGDAKAQAAADLIMLRQQIVNLDTPPAMVVFDTLNRTMLGEENSATDVGHYITALSSFREENPDITVVVVHHLGKDATKGARGSVALHAGADFEYHLTKSTDMARITHLTTAKMKDAEPPEPMALVAETVIVGLDPDNGDPVTSLVLTQDHNKLEEQMRCNDMGVRTLNLIKTLAKAGMPACHSKSPNSKHSMLNTLHKLRDVDPQALGDYPLNQVYDHVERLKAQGHVDMVSVAKVEGRTYRNVVTVSQAGEDYIVAKSGLEGDHLESVWML